MFASLSNVAPSLLMDRTLFDFVSLRVTETGAVNDDDTLNNHSDEGMSFL